ncbi:hypothetical protein LXA43DRAFT_132708 [Ganoderma leucocontextum]|nr:hypothetical protein LXA43DRAFT_132708 [Ganoderma leucocontextum]
MHAFQSKDADKPSVNNPRPASKVRTPSLVGEFPTHPTTHLRSYDTDSPNEHAEHTNTILAFPKKKPTANRWSSLLLGTTIATERDIQVSQIIMTNNQIVHQSPLARVFPKLSLSPLPVAVVSGGGDPTKLLKPSIPTSRILHLVACAHASAPIHLEFPTLICSSGNTSCRPPSFPIHQSSALSAHSITPRPEVQIPIRLRRKVVKRDHVLHRGFGLGLHWRRRRFASAAAGAPTLAREACTARAEGSGGGAFLHVEDGK